MKWYLAVFKKYADFNGRARRKEYWMFYLINSIILTILASIGGDDSKFSIFSIIYVFYIIAMLIPSLAVIVRRLHDIGKSGKWYFIGFIPIIGTIWLLIMLCTEGTPGSNMYGEDPKQINELYDPSTY